MYAVGRKYVLQRTKNVINEHYYIKIINSFCIFATKFKL